MNSPHMNSPHKLAEHGDLHMPVSEPLAPAEDHSTEFSLSPQPSINSSSLSIPLESSLSIAFETLSINPKSRNLLVVDEIEYYMESNETFFKSLTSKDTMFVAEFLYETLHGQQSRYVI